MVLLVQYIPALRHKEASAWVEEGTFRVIKHQRRIKLQATLGASCNYLKKPQTTKLQFVRFRLHFREKHLYNKSGKSERDAPKDCNWKCLSQTKLQSLESCG